MPSLTIGSSQARSLYAVAFNEMIGNKADDQFEQYKARWVVIYPPWYKV